MQLNFGACCFDSRSRARLHLIDGLIVKSSRISHLGFLRLNARAGLDDLQIGAADGERDHVENVLVAEPRCLLGGSRRSESLDGFEAEDRLAQARTHRAVAERTDDRRDARNILDSLGREVYLSD